jgi:hypothetical protein
MFNQISQDKKKCDPAPVVTQLKLHQIKFCSTVFSPFYSSTEYINTVLRAYKE